MRAFKVLEDYHFVGRFDGRAALFSDMEGVYYVHIVVADTIEMILEVGSLSSLYDSNVMDGLENYLNDPLQQLSYNGIVQYFDSFLGVEQSESLKAH